MKNQDAPRHLRERVPLWLVLPALVATPVAAQTLDEQYVFYLDGKCSAMDFERDADAILIPGQAGPQMQAYCSGLPNTGGGGSTSASGGAAGSSSGQSGAAATDAAPRKRRDRARQEDADVADDMSIVEMGRLSAFFSMDYQNEHQHATHYEAGRRSDLAGLLLGSDYRFGTRGLVGLGIRLNQRSGDFDHDAGDFRMRTGGAVLYGSWFPSPNVFVDASAGIDRREYDAQRIVTVRKEVFGNPMFPPTVSYDPPPAAVDADTRGTEWDIELRSGADFPAGKMTLGPRLTITSRHTDTDAFTETGLTPMTLTFDAQTEESLRSAVGFQASRAFMRDGSVWVAQLNADWVHEFEDNQRVITAHFAEDLRPGPSQLAFLDAPPDRDVYVGRLSLVAVFPHGFSAFGSVEALFGHEYIDRYGATIGLRREF
ncbi:autotransporter outer membrane beta-barrel domain-containing protein [Povalibacter sp.]|uniref:autotransporter outer membrane beta-barrel domain-containing protein n=1 Tax=Povalibacter sp. TaxID=1962978 RepID=UPI002F413A08